MSEMIDLDVDNFFYLCRLCALKCSLPGVAIFSNEGICHEIRKKIENCFNFTINEQDTYPKTICHDCLYKLDYCYDFLCKSLESQQFLSELLKHEIFDAIYMTRDDLQHQQLCLELNELPDQSEIQDLEHLVEAAHIHADSNDITQIIQYHDGEINEEQIKNEINQLDKMSAMQKDVDDNDSLPDITLYSFDNIAKDDNEYLNNANYDNNNAEILENVFDNVETPAGTIDENVQAPAEILAVIENVLEAEMPKPKLKSNKKVPKICSYCHKEFGTNYKLNEHMRTHTAETPFKCAADGCNKTFRSKIGLQQHEATHTGNFKFSCEICGKGFQIKSYLTIHSKVHSNQKTYKCSTCDVHLKSKQALIDHENRHLGVKAYECSQCDQKFITKSLCITHEKTQHSGEEMAKYPCSVCSKMFVRRSYLKTHMTIHSGNKAFICDICGKDFLTATDLKQHLTTHTGEREFVCEVCGKAFSRADGLNVHMRSHTGQKPYKCDFCGQQFAQICTLKIHTRLHTGEKPYVCTLCPRRFVARSYLKTHLKKHSPKVPVATEFDSIEPQQQLCQLLDDNQVQNDLVFDDEHQMLDPQNSDLFELNEIIAT